MNPSPIENMLPITTILDLNKFPIVSGLVLDEMHLFMLLGRGCFVIKLLDFCSPLFCPSPELTIPRKIVTFHDQIQYNYFYSIMQATNSLLCTVLNPYCDQKIIAELFLLMSLYFLMSRVTSIRYILIISRISMGNFNIIYLIISIS